MRTSRPSITTSTGTPRPESARRCGFWSWRSEIRRAASWGRLAICQSSRYARHMDEDLIEAEHDAEIARAGFHRAVRRLHLNGGSLREIAPTLGLSHQRVHQIVE